MMENDVGRVTDDPRVEKIARELFDIFDVAGLAVDLGALTLVEAELDLAVVADRLISILDNERIATRSDECRYCEGRGIYYGKDVVTGESIELACQYCNETGKVPADRLATPSNEALLREARDLIFASLYHLRTDARAEAYHKQALAFIDRLTALNPPGVE